MTLQKIDTTTGAGDNLKAGGDKINDMFAQLYSPNIYPTNKKVGSRTITGKTQLIPLTATSGLFPGQTASAETTGVTMDIRVALPCAFDAIRILVPNRAAAPVTGMKVALSLVTASQGFVSTKPQTGGNLGQATGANPNDVTVVPSNSLWGVSAAGGRFRRFFFDNHSKSEIDLPPAVDAGVGIPSYTPTDWMPCVPVARTDGGTLPLIAVRLQYPPAGTTPASGAAPSSPGVTYSALGFGNWGIDGALDSARPFNGGHLWKAFAHNAQGIDTSINFQGSNTPQTMALSVPIIVQFRAVGEVFTVMYLNDSIGEYSNGEYGANYAFRGAMAAATAQGKALAWCPLTWPSGPLAAYGRLGLLLADLIKPTVVWGKPIGPNETSAPLTQATQDAAMANLGFVLELGRRTASRVIIEPELAINNAGAYTFGATDSFRVAWNAAYAAQAVARGYTFAPLDAPWSATGTVVSGQQQPNPANTTDGVHPSDAGSTALTPVATTAAATALALV